MHKVEGLYLQPEKVEPGYELIAHDHGANRDGPCLGCEAIVLGGESITCPECDGTGGPQVEGHIACWQCGGNHGVVKCTAATLDKIYNP